MSWQLTSDINPTKVQIYVNPGEISGAYTITDTPQIDGAVQIEYKTVTARRHISTTFEQANPQATPKLTARIAGRPCGYEPHLR